MEIKQGGVVSRLLADVPIPRMFRAEQLFPRERIAPADIPAAVAGELSREPFRSKIRPGMSKMCIRDRSTPTTPPAWSSPRRAWTPSWP